MLGWMGNGCILLTTVWRVERWFVLSDHWALLTRYNCIGMYVVDIRTQRIFRKENVIGNCHGNRFRWNCLYITQVYEKYNKDKFEWARTYNLFWEHCETNQTKQWTHANSAEIGNDFFKTLFLT